MSYSVRLTTDGLDVVLRRLMPGPQTTAFNQVEMNSSSLLSTR